MKIRFCEHNKGKGKLLRRLKDEYPDLNIKVKECIKQCGACREMPVAMVDKKKVTGKNGEDLYLKLIELIRQDSGAETGASS